MFSDKSLWISAKLGSLPLLQIWYQIVAKRFFHKALCKLQQDKTKLLARKRINRLSSENVNLRVVVSRGKSAFGVRSGVANILFTSLPLWPLPLSLMKHSHRVRVNECLKNEKVNRQMGWRDLPESCSFDRNVHDSFCLFQQTTLMYVWPFT